MDKENWSNSNERLYTVNLYFGVEVKIRTVPMPSVMLQCKTEARCSHPSRAAQFLLKLRPTACSFLFSKVSQRCCVQLLLLLQYLLRNVTARVGGEKWPLRCHYSRQVTKPEGSADVLIPYKWKASKDDIFVLFILSKVLFLLVKFQLKTLVY